LGDWRVNKSPYFTERGGAKLQEPVWGIVEERIGEGGFNL